jgi:hypothetical protein
VPALCAIEWNAIHDSDASIEGHEVFSGQAARKFVNQVATMAELLVLVMLYRLSSAVVPADEALISARLRGGAGA